MSKKHTQLPWRFGRTDMSESIMILDYKNDYVATIQIRQIGGGAISEAMEGPRRANAHFIVRACNSHDALLEALKNSLPLIAGKRLKGLNDGTIKPNADELMLITAIALDELRTEKEE